MQRLFIGDVQGCAEELAELLARAKRAFGDDFSLYSAGDLVNRGPDNRRVLEQVRALVEAGRGECVLGNHEIHAIAVHLGLRDLSPNDSIEDVLGAPDAKEWIDWLRARPLAVGAVAGRDRFVMVHASVAPGWSYEDVLAHAGAAAARLRGSDEATRAFLSSDPTVDPVRDDLARLTRGRSATPSGWSSREPESPAEAWHAIWRQGDPDYGVVYGHWARQGLHIAPGLRGLDTGCVHHGRGRDGFLTAWLPDQVEGGSALDAPDDRFWQIAAKRRYYYPSHERG